MPNQKQKAKLSKQRIVFLDYLRIFAFVSVLVGHKFYSHAEKIIDNETIHATPRFILELLLPLCKGGGAGVVVFFLVSGYIITHVLQVEQTTDFFIKRIFRIYPLYIIAVLLQSSLQFVASGTFPDIYTIIPQLLLIGDFFHSPYTLGGVEWTLRVEILFYLFMGFLRYCNVLPQHNRLLPWILISVTLILGFLPPFPSFSLGTRGYLTIYGPFLFLGAFYYLKEIKQISSSMLTGFTLLVLFRYYYLIAVYQSYWLEYHFATLSVVLFFVMWRFQVHFMVTSSVLFLSDLTYSVYLFHNWTWGPIKMLLHTTSINILHPDIQALLVLLLFCFFMLKIIEKPGIQCGRIILQHLRKRRTVN